MAKAAVSMSSSEFAKLIRKNPRLVEEKTAKAVLRGKKVGQPVRTDIMAVLQSSENSPPEEAEMNGTEAKIAQELELAKSKGEIQDWYFEKIALKIAPKTWYFPDFTIVGKNGEIHILEVKGFLRDDAAAKYKVAVGLFPKLHFHMVKRKDQKWKEMYKSLLNPPNPGKDGKKFHLHR